MQPYQEESQEINRQQSSTGNFIKKAGSAALGVTGIGLTSKFASKVLPFLSEYIPESLAIKGLSKINPNIGKFIKGSMEQGHTFENVKDFLKEKIQDQEQEGTKKESGKENPKEKRNIIEQYDPELHTYLEQNLKKGMPLLEAGQQATKHGRFKKAIEKMTKDHKTPWSAILQTVYGQMGKPQQQEQQQPQQGQQGGQGQAALMSILQKIQQARGGQ